MKKRIFLFCFLCIFILLTNYAQYNSNVFYFDWITSINNESSQSGEAHLSSDKPYIVEGTVNSNEPSSVKEAYALPIEPDLISNWKFMGPLGFPKRVNSTATGGSVGKGQVKSIYVNPNNLKHIYAGTMRGGLWKTTNNGISWNCLTEHVPGINGIESISVHPSNSNIIYIVVANQYYSVGIYKTVNGGQTWTSISDIKDHENKLMLTKPTTHTKLVKLIMDPNNPNNLYILNSKAWSSDNYIHRSIDAGQTWTLVYHDPLRDDYFHDIVFVFDKNGNKKIVASSDKIVVSINNGLSWAESDIRTKVLNEVGFPNETLTNTFLTSNISFPGQLWLGTLLQDNNNFYLVKYDFDTDLATLLPGSIETGGCIRHQKIKVSPLNSDIIYLGNSSSSVRRYDGANYQDLNCTRSSGCPFSGTSCVGSAGPDNPNWIHTDIRDIQVFSEDIDGDGILDDAVFTGDDGGVSRNTAINDNDYWEWENISDDNAGNDGLYVTEFNSIGSVESDPDLFAGGAHDNNCFVYNHGVWEQFNSGDGGPIEINYNNPDVFYAKNNGSLSRFSGMGANNERLLLSNGSCGNSFTELHPTDPTIVFHGDKDTSKDLFKITNASGSSISENITPDYTDGFNGRTNFGVASLAISPSNPDVMYVFSSYTYKNAPVEHKEVVFRTFDGGNNWEDISTKDSDIVSAYNWFYADASVVHHNKPNELWVGFNRFGTGERVFHSTDYGDSWTAINTGLPESGVWIRDLAYDPDGHYLYAATDKGVWVYDNIKETWIDYTYGTLPYCIVSEIDLNFKFRKILISTFGYGIWKADFKFCPNKSDINEWTSTSSNKRLESTTYIKSASTISSNSKVVYEAKDYIELNPGFVSSNDFTAQIISNKSCGNSMSNQNIMMAEDANTDLTDNIENNYTESNDIEETESSIGIYPNPNNGLFTIKVNNDISMYDVKIYNLNGFELFYFKNQLGNSNIDLTHISKGMYIVRILTAKNILTKRIVIK